jgi:hypothetical protein
MNTLTRLSRAAGLVLALALSAGSSHAEVANVSTQALANMPLASYGQGQSMMQQALSHLSLDVRVTFLDKDYEKDVYVREPVTGKKVRVSCVRFRSSSGFQLKMDPPGFSLTPQQLTVTANISRVRADGLAFKFMVGPCNWVGAGLGVQLTDVKVVYKARPMLSFENGACRLAWNGDPNGVSVAIGDLNIIGVQNDLDKLAKDAVREALNLALDGAFGVALRNEVQGVVVQTCGGSSGRR